MVPAAYLDIEVLAGHDTGLSAPALRSRLMLILHGAFRKMPETYALAIPEGRTSLRIFASNRAEFDSLVDALQPNAWIRDYARIGYSRDVPSDFSGPWAAYCRYRIPTAKSDRDCNSDQSSKLRDRRLNHAQQHGFEFFNISSSSTRQAFSLTVERIQMPRSTGEAAPNSYGLSTTTNLFAVPVVS